MKAGRALTVAVMMMLAGITLGVTGCAYTTVVGKARVPEPGPAVSTNLQAVMSQVEDKRAWQPVMTSGTPMAAPEEELPFVHIFAPQITQYIRDSLLTSGLFQALPAPEDAAAKNLDGGLTFVMNDFSLAPMGYNAWMAAHLLVDGVLLPAVTVVALSTQGDIDLGGYYIPSQYMGTNLAMDVSYTEKGFKQPILRRSYLIQVELDAVSESTLRERLHDNAYAGAELGKEEGAKALEALAKTISADPHWAYLQDYRRLSEAEELFADNAPLEEQIAGLESVLYLLKPPAYTEEEVSILQDGFLDEDSRAKLINDMRIRWFGSEDPEELPAAEITTPEQAELLFDDPVLANSQVEAHLANRVLSLASKVLVPPAERPRPEKAQAVVTPTKVGLAPSAASPIMMPGPSAGLTGTEAERFNALPVINAQARPVFSSGQQPEADSEVDPGDSVPEEPANAAALRQALSARVAERLRGQMRLQVGLLNLAGNAVGTTWPAMENLLSQIPDPMVARYLALRNQL